MIGICLNRFDEKSMRTSFTKSSPKVPSAMVLRLNDRCSPMRLVSCSVVAIRMPRLSNSWFNSSENWSSIVLSLSCGAVILGWNPRSDPSESNTVNLKNGTSLFNSKYSNSTRRRNSFSESISLSNFTTVFDSLVLMGFSFGDLTVELALRPFFFLMPETYCRAN